MAEGKICFAKLSGSISGTFFGHRWADERSRIEFAWGPSSDRHEEQSPCPPTSALLCDVLHARARKLCKPAVP